MELLAQQQKMELLAQQQNMELLAQQQKMELLIQLDTLYGSAVEVSFLGEVVGKQTMDKKEWTVIEIDGVFFEQKLKNIYSVGDGKVWKGFTGPPTYTNYRIWVPEPNSVYTGNFKVVNWKRFDFTTPSRTYSLSVGYYFHVIPIPIPILVSQAQ